MTSIHRRRLLRQSAGIGDDAHIDAMVIVTCNHWHALAAIWACQRGKDVYVEKPPARNYWEAKQVVRAARNYNRIVQTCGRPTDQSRQAALRLALALEYR